jgi:predicted nucleotidyltransferase component of viral defense system
LISEARVRTLARQDGVTAGLAEKNYVNSWVLYAIYSSDIDGLVFKGGTALSKLYFPELWRFSEDLDFTATEEIPDLRTRLETMLVLNNTLKLFEVWNRSDEYSSRVVAGVYCSTPRVGSALSRSEFIKPRRD